MLKKSCIWTGVILVCLLATGVSASEKVYEDMVPLKAGGKVQLTLSGSDITVESADTNQVSYRIVVKGKDNKVENYDVTVEHSEDRLEITSEHQKNWGGWSWGSFSVKTHVVVPRECDLHLKTSGGFLNVTGVTGNIEVATSGGDVALRNLAGDIVANTSGGEIEVSDYRGPLDVKTSGGDITINDGDGALYANTSGGDIEIRRISGDLKAKTSGGDITVADSDGFKRLNTSGGNLSVTKGNGDIDAYTSSGYVRLLDVSGGIKAKTSGGSIEISLIGSNQGVEAHTSGGSVTLHASPEIKGDLYAKTSGGRVKVNFPVTLNGRVDDNKVEGKLNGGGEMVRLTTSGGNINILEK